MTTLIFLESSAKQRTIQSILGSGYCIMATQGHICELEMKGKYNLGVNLENFVPSYAVLSFKKQKLKFWKKIIEENVFQNILLATDPDREGEGIAREIVEQLQLKEGQYKRIVFYEITPSAIKKALLEPAELDTCLIESQMSRQVLDKMIGFCISPLLYKKIKAISAGRVQSVVLKMIIERELSIEEFEKREKRYFIEGEGTPSSKREKVKVKQVTQDNDLILYVSQEEALKKIENLDSELKIVKKNEEEKRYPSKVPFTTSSLLSEAKNVLGFSIRQTTKIAQKLYEGVFLKEENISTGLITYPRTDSLRINENFSRNAYNYIEKKWGKEYCNFNPIWKNLKTKHSQDAHESIHPTSLREPEELKTSLESDEYRLYELIFESSLICLMSFAKIERVSYLLTSKNNYFSYTENLVKFLGFFAVNPERYFSAYGVKSESSLKTETLLKIDKWEITEYTVGKPVRYNEGSLVKELEKLGIGRPSTYNSFGATLLKRRYVHLNERGQFVPNKLGYDVNDWLQEYFSTIINQEYTALLENELDRISNGKNTYFNFIRGFWEEFSKVFQTLE